METDPRQALRDHSAKVIREVRDHLGATRPDLALAFDGALVLGDLKDMIEGQAPAADPRPQALVPGAEQIEFWRSMMDAPPVRPWTKEDEARLLAADPARRDLAEIPLVRPAVPVAEQIGGDPAAEGVAELIGALVEAARDGGIELVPEHEEEESEQVDVADTTEERVDEPAEIVQLPEEPAVEQIPAVVEPDEARGGASTFQREVSEYYQTHTVAATYQRFGTNMATLRAALAATGIQERTREQEAALAASRAGMRGARDKKAEAAPEPPQEPEPAVTAIPQQLSVPSPALGRGREFEDQDAESKQARLEGKVAAALVELPALPLPEGLTGPAFAQLCRLCLNQGPALLKRVIDTGTLVLLSISWPEGTRLRIADLAERHALAAGRLAPFEQQEYFRQIVVALPALTKAQINGPADPKPGKPKAAVA